MALTLSKLDVLTSGAAMLSAVSETDACCASQALSSAATSSTSLRTTPNPLWLFLRPPLSLSLPATSAPPPALLFPTCNATLCVLRLPMHPVSRVTFVFSFLRRKSLGKRTSGS
eukprot:1003976-Rhodomonas_salina.1